MCFIHIRRTHELDKLHNISGLQEMSKNVSAQYTIHNVTEK